MVCHPTRNIASSYNKLIDTNLPFLGPGGAVFTTTVRISSMLTLTGASIS